MLDPDRDNLGRAEQDREPLVQYEDLEQATGFTQISNAILRCYPELSDGEKMTYAVLKSFAYVGPETFVGEETLARARDVTVSTVSRHLNRLIDVGLVKVRRRGQGKTNVWIIARIPRAKLNQYLAEWRPNLQLRQNPQTKTSQDSQVKTEQDAQAKNGRDSQAEEEYVSETQNKKRRRSSRPGTTPSSSGALMLATASEREEDGAYPSLQRLVENSEAVESGFSTVVDNVGNLAALAAEYFDAAGEEASVERFLSRYEPHVVMDAFEAVARRLERGDRIAKPIAYFYAVVKVMQAEHDERMAEHDRDERERWLIARNWARSLLREWSPDQVRAILADTYSSETLVAEIMAEVADGPGDPDAGAVAPGEGE